MTRDLFRRGQHEKGTTIQQASGYFTTPKLPICDDEEP